jgi:hypothetical protein
MDTPLPNPRDLDAVRTWLTHTQPDLTAVRAWTAPLLAAADRAGPMVPLGGPAWQALPDHDPRKPAALITAALARLAETTPSATALRLAREIHAENHAIADRLKAASVDLSTAQDWRVAADRPSHAELCRRRGDHPTGWDVAA